MMTPPTTAITAPSLKRLKGSDSVNVPFMYPFLCCKTIVQSTRCSQINTGGGHGRSNSFSEISGSHSA